MEETLEEKVTDLEQKSERIRSARNVESKLESATNSIERLERRLSSVADTADELAFYVDVLEKVFGGDRPDRVGEAITSAQRAADIDDDAVIDAAEQQDFSELFDRVETAKNELEDAINVLDAHITDHYQSPREDELTAARELNRIIGGGDDEFLDIISAMKTFLNREIWDVDKSPQGLSARWDRLLEKWEANSGKHGWESFQEEHGLSDDTVDDLQQFTTKDTVRISDLSLTTLREVKQVDELESALQVELTSQ